MKLLQPPKIDHCLVCKEHIDGGEPAIIAHIRSSHTREDVVIALAREHLLLLLEFLLIVVAALAWLAVSDNAGWLS